MVRLRHNYFFNFLGYTIVTILHNTWVMYWSTIGIFIIDIIIKKLCCSIFRKQCFVKILLKSSKKHIDTVIAFHNLIQR